MEVDPSLQTKMLNYGNRPMLNLKRPHPASQQHHNFKRQAHPLENVYPVPGYGERNGYGYDYQYDHGQYDQQYFDYAIFNDSYDPSEQPAYEIGEVPETESNVCSESNAFLREEANFLEWHPRW